MPESTLAQKPALGQNRPDRRNAVGDTIRFFSFDARVARPRLLIGIVIGLSLGWLGVLILRERTGVATWLVGGLAGLTIA